MKTKKKSKKDAKIRTIGDMPPNVLLDGVKFYLPGTKSVVHFISAWWNPGENGTGVWYKKSLASEQTYPLFLKGKEEILKLKLVE